MKNDNKDSLKKLWEDSQVPEVSNKEWDDVWTGVHRRLKVPRTTAARPGWLQGLSYAAVLAVGVVIGIYGPNVSSEEKPEASAPPVKSEIAEPDITPGNELPVEVKDDEGIAFMGLKDVDIQTTGQTEEGLKEYRLTAYTPRGVKIVWDYSDVNPLENNL